MQQAAHRSCGEAGPGPRVTVVMPCFNAVAHLQTSIDSVRRQTLEDWVLIAVDDGSTDGTAAVLTGLDDSRIHVIRQANAGVSAARNRALEEVETPFVAFLDADDTWAPDFLAALVSALEAHPEADLAYGGWQDVHQPPRRNLAHDPPDYAAQEDRFAALLERCPWVIHAAVSRTGAVRRAGGFDRRFTVAEDYLMWLRMAVHSRFVKVTGIRAYYRHDADHAQATANALRVARQTRQVKEVFLREQPLIAARLGRTSRRFLYGQSLTMAYDAYWARDLSTARALFRDCIAGGYLRPRDLKYALLAWLPAPIHRHLAGTRDRLTAAP